MNSKTYNISQEFYAACQILGIDDQALLKAHALNKGVRHFQSLNLTAGQVNSLLEAAIIQYGQDDFHIKLADGFSKAAFGHAFLALQCSENLLDAMHRVARFKEICEPVRWQVNQTKTDLTIEIQSSSKDFTLHATGQIMSFMWLVKSCRNVTAKKLRPHKITLNEPVPHQSEIEKELDCEIQISDKATISFKVTDLTHPILSKNRFIISSLESGADKKNRTINHDSNFINAVSHIVNELLPSGVISSERVAQRLAISKRTLERRLSEQGVCFSEVVRQCRQSMARYYLHDTQFPLGEISLLLGFREINSFYRAFKNWYGCTPIEFRSQA